MVGEVFFYEKSDTSGIATRKEYNARHSHLVRKACGP